MAVMRFCTKHAINYGDKCPECYLGDIRYDKTDRWDFAHRVPLSDNVEYAIAPRPVLSAFTMAMEAKLRKNDHKTGWRDLPVEAIKKLMDIERQELEVAMDFLSNKEAMGECIDIANFAMMLFDRLSMEEDKNSGATK